MGLVSGLMGNAGRVNAEVKQKGYGNLLAEKWTCRNRISFNPRHIF